MKTIPVYTTSTGYEFPEHEQLPDGGEALRGFIEHHCLETLKQLAVNLYGECEFVIDPIPPY